MSHLTSKLTQFLDWFNFLPQIAAVFYSASGPPHRRDAFSEDTRSDSDCIVKKGCSQKMSQDYSVRGETREDS